MSYTGQQPSDLEPVDSNQCQGEKIKSTPFRLGGPSTTVTRCEKEPYFVAFENAPGKDKKRGAMSLCLECAQVMTKQLGEKYCTLFLLIAPRGGRKK